MPESLDAIEFRETDIISISELTQEFLRPERIRLKLDGILPIDIGSIAYTRLTTSNPRKPGQPFSVDEASFMPSRRELIKCILESFLWISRTETIFTKNYFYTSILRWCDNNNCSDAFSNADVTVSALKAYTQNLNHRISTNEIAPSSAGTMQKQFIALAKLRFPKELKDLQYSVIPIKCSRGTKSPPSEVEVKKYIGTCVPLARALKGFLINRERYPFPVAMDDFEIVFFPSRDGICTPFSKKVSAYNPKSHRIATVEEYLTSRNKNLCEREIKTAKGILRKVQKNIDLCNRNERCNERMRLASLALGAYTIILSCLIGATLSELSQFDYVEGVELERSPVKKELSAVKFRANGRKTRYAIGRNEGLTFLREYLELRRWILNGKTFEKLFFSMGRRGTENLKSITNQFHFDFHLRLSGLMLDPSIPPLATRRIRRYKSVALHSLGLKPDVVAHALNHSTSTNLNSYSLGTIEQQATEFEVYWASVRKAADSVSKSSSDREIPISSGHCKSFNSPKPEHDYLIIKPTCINQYGCLFCQNYICHADPVDIHKLMSLQFVINSVRKSVPDFKHADALFRDLSIRIEFILSSIEERASENVEIIARVRRQVHELGILSPYWEQRLQRYEKLGVLF